MNHPSREEWMSYLYGELPRRSKATLQSHLRACPDCQNNVREWQTAMSGLNAWALTPIVHHPHVLPAAWKWGVAALFALGLGYGLGQFSARPVDEAALRAGIERSLKSSLENEIQTRVRRRLAVEIKSMLAGTESQLIDRMDALAVKTVATSSDQAQGLFSAYDDVLKKLDARLDRQATDLAALTKDTETLAVVTEFSFRRSEQQLAQLADYTESADGRSNRTRPQTSP